MTTMADCGDGGAVHVHLLVGTYSSINLCICLVVLVGYFNCKRVWSSDAFSLLLGTLQRAKQLINTFMLFWVIYRFRRMQ